MRICDQFTKVIIFVYKPARVIGVKRSKVCLVFQYHHYSSPALITLGSKNYSLEWGPTVENIASGGVSCRFQAGLLANGAHY